jgi:DNA-binding XRE family transcriptional regulator
MKRRKKNKETNLVSLEELKDYYYGKRGTRKRDKLERESEAFRIAVMLQMARQELGMTQEELAAKAGTTKSYISKIENNVKEARISTLQRIVERGLGGKLELRISF